LPHIGTIDKSTRLTRQQSQSFYIILFNQIADNLIQFFQHGMGQYIHGFISDINGQPDISISITIYFPM
jgi:hypothetical protein